MNFKQTQEETLAKWDQISKSLDNLRDLMSAPCGFCKKYRDTTSVWKQGCEKCPLYSDFWCLDRDSLYSDITRNARAIVPDIYLLKVAIKEAEEK